MKLTEKQKRFVEEYLIDLNATQSAIRAGYSENTAMEQGYQLLQKTSVQNAIQEAMNKRSKRTEITQDRVLQELAKVGFADIKDYLSFRTGKTVVGYEDGDPIVDYSHIIELRDSEEVDGSVISEVSLKDGALKFKLHDKMKALNDIGRHLGMFVDKQEVNVTSNQKLEDFFK